MRQLPVLALCLLACSCAQDEEPAAVAASTEREVNTGSASAGATDREDIADIPPAIEVTVSDVAYGLTPERNLNGYLVLPADVVEPAPGIILIHGQGGLNDYIRAMARRLAGEGYAVLAVDFFAGQTADSAGQAEALHAEFMSDRAAVLDNIGQARSYLENNAYPPGIGALGFGRGGEWALEAALAFGDGIDAVAMFYGRVINDGERLRTLTAPLIGVFASLDTTIPVREVTQFRSSLRELDKDALVLIHSNVAHDFANPDSAAYDHAAATENWVTVLEFLDGHLH
jgi:carboxymethylenebutenolidase